MKIKITNNSKPASWYKDRIGETFAVLGVDVEKEYYVVHRGRVVDSFVCFSDCEVLNEEEPCPICKNSPYVSQYSREVRVAKCINCGN